jgi:hypothetical protein
MQNQSKIEQVLESARTELNSGEQILTVGHSINGFSIPFTAYVGTRFLVILAISFAFIFLLRVPALELLVGTVLVSSFQVLFLLFVGCLLCPVIDLIRYVIVSSKRELCVITTRRVFAIQLSSSQLVEVARKTDIAKIQSEKDRLTLTMSDGSKRRMNVIEGLSLLSIRYRQPGICYSTLDSTSPRDI